MRRGAVALLSWLPLVVLMIANGVLRAAAFEPRMSELSAHQLSTASGALVVALYTWLVFPRLGLSCPRDAARLGAAWLAFTVAFEFGFGRAVAGHSWTRLLHDYDLAAGRVWPLLLAWVAATPWIVFRLRGRRGSPRSM